MRNLVVQNNAIDKVLTSALMHDSKKTLIENNSICNLSFLSLDSNTQHFILKGNTIKSIALQSLVVNTTDEIIILNNTFFHIEKDALSGLKSSGKAGSFVFSGNHIYAHEEGSLTFYSKVLGKNLKIMNNTLHMETCDCSTLKLLNTMTYKNSIKHKRLVYEMFENSSFCCDKESKTTKLVDICKKPSHREHLNTGRASLIAAILIVSIFGCIVLTVWQRKMKIPYKRLRANDNTLT